MRTIRSAAAFLPVLAATALVAQNPPQRPPAAPDSAPMYERRPGMMEPGDQERRERMMRQQGEMQEQRERMLRQQVEMRFNEVIRGQLELNDQQMGRLQTAMRANQDRRRELMRREMDTRRAMAGQMQPGVAANPDSLNRLLEQSSRLRIERAQSDDQFMRDLNFLTPVQRTRFVFLMQRFEERLQQIRQRGGPGGPGMGPGEPGMGPDGPGMGRDRPADGAGGPGMRPRGQQGPGGRPAPSQPRQRPR